MNAVGDKYMARVFLTEAKRRRLSGHRDGFYWTLLRWAANRRRAAQTAPGQRELFRANCISEAVAA